ncbi:MAG: Bud site selection protein 20 [Chrysothrix sp. TS-e1954]|nr:MAG: Bud site selection protein 20 [Chrysothrix sp. TS-e1954]
MPAIRGSKSKSKTRRRRRDLDQVHEDLHDPKRLAQHKDAKAIEDLPGLGQHYCVECAKWFESESSIVQHRRGKPHKKRVKQLAEEPYTQEIADAAVGLRRENGSRDKMTVDDEDAQLAKGSQAKDVLENDDEEYGAFFSAY